MQEQISKGAIRVSDDLIIGGYAQSCLLCDTTLSSDGCTNPDCSHFRPEPLLQRQLRILVSSTNFKFK